MKKLVKNIILLTLAISLIAATGCDNYSKHCGCPSKKGIVGYN
jgi:hypothetical protein